MTLKAGGTEAHLPTLHNVEQRRPPAMTSSDVRQARETEGHPSKGNLHVHDV